MYSFDRCNEESKEQQIIAGAASRRIKIHTCIGDQRPVIVFTRSVKTCKRFFVEKRPEMVFVRHSRHYIHHQLVVVVRNVHLFKQRSYFKLARSNLIVTRANRNAKLPALNLKFLHEVINTGRNGSEIMVLHLLATSWCVTEHCSAGHYQVRTSIIQGFINYEIFLFRS